MTEIELAWAAGFLEGEGKVRINKPTKRNRGALLVSVVNTDSTLVVWFQTRWPGYMKSATGLREAQRPAWVWVIAARQAAAFLVAIRPYAVSDRMLRRIDLALEFQAQKTNGRANRTPDYLDEQDRYYREMADLNRRGVA